MERMEKLIELAIKYDREKEGTSFDWCITNGDFENHIYQKYLISKEYGFIQRLVEQDKIDLEKLPIRFEQYYQNSEVADYIVEDEKILLMLLSISEQPIELLCQIIK